MKHEFLATLRNYGIAGAAVILMTTVGSAKPAHAQKDPAPTSGGQSTPGTFFCNATALNPGERAFHQRLTERLIASTSTRPSSNAGPVD